MTTPCLAWTGTRNPSAVPIGRKRGAGEGGVVVGGGVATPECVVVVGVGDLPTVFSLPCRATRRRSPPRQPPTREGGEYGEGHLPKAMVNASFGGGSFDAEAQAAGGGGRPKTRREIMQQIMLRSKAYKLLRQREQEAQEDATEALDADIDGENGVSGSRARVCA